MDSNSNFEEFTTFSPLDTHTDQFFDARAPDLSQTSLMTPTDLFVQKHDPAELPHIPVSQTSRVQSSVHARANIRENATSATSNPARQQHAQARAFTIPRSRVTSSNAHPFQSPVTGRLMHFPVYQEQHNTAVRSSAYPLDNLQSSAFPGFPLEPNLHLNNRHPVDQEQLGSLDPLHSHIVQSQNRRENSSQSYNPFQGPLFQFGAIDAPQALLNPDLTQYPLSDCPVVEEERKPTDLDSLLTSYSEPYLRYSSILEHTPDPFLESFSLPGSQLPSYSPLMNLTRSSNPDLYHGSFDQQTDTTGLNSLPPHMIRYDNSDQYFNSPEEARSYLHCLRWSPGNHIGIPHTNDQKSVYVRMIVEALTDYSGFYDKTESKNKINRLVSQRYPMPEIWARSWEAVEMAYDLHINGCTLPMSEDPTMDLKSIPKGAAPDDSQPAYQDKPRAEFDRNLTFDARIKELCTTVKVSEQIFSE